MLNIGVICPSEIAFRRFMPALQKNLHFHFAGIGVCSGQERFGKEYSDNARQRAVLEEEDQKAKKFVVDFGGELFHSYGEIACSEQIDALYIPLPPALHVEWASVALKHGKHVIVEKPATISLKDTKKLIQIASENKLALHENYMFIFHKQLEDIKEIIDNGQIGEPRLYRINFGFPKRAANDFRYNKELGGGALIDAGGYTLKYASMLLGESAKIVSAQMNHGIDYAVDIYGSAMLVNDFGTTAQIAYGMDNNYKCELEVWGSKGCLNTGRVLTAPLGFVPEVQITKGGSTEIHQLSADDAFYKSIQYFEKCIIDKDMRYESYKSILKQAQLVDDFMVMAREKN